MNHDPAARRILGTELSRAWDTTALRPGALRATFLPASGGRPAKFRPDIEGLRALAIVAVVLCHASSSLVPGGYIGVDVFFVISGYLITQIILDGVEKGSFSYYAFTKARIRRIFPALFFMLCVVSLAALVTLSPRALKEFGETLVATSLFVSNMEFYRLSGYFGGAAEFKPLLHTWSLAVEGQFYIFFPLVLMATKRWLRGRYLIVVIPCAALSLLLSCWLVPRFPGAAFYFGQSRAFELMVGALLALNALPQLSNNVVREALAAMGMGTIAICALAFDQSTPFPGLYALLPCLGAAVIIYSGQSGHSATATLLSLPGVRFVGAISYSLYLWHWPALSLARSYYLTDLTPFQTACALSFATAMAVISWRFVEKPFRSRAWAEKPIFSLAGAGMAGAAALSAMMLLSAGLPERFSAETIRLFEYSNDFNHRRSQCHDGQDHEVSFAGNCVFGTPGARSDVAVWGDSHGAELSVALGGALGVGHAVMEVTSSACPPALDFNPPGRPNCAAHNREALNHLVRDKRLRTVVLIARYRQYSRSELWPAFQKGFEEAIRELASSGKQVIVVYPVPGYPNPVPDAVGMMFAHGLPPENYRQALSQYRQDNAAAIAEMDSVVAEFHLQSVATENVFCRQQYCLTYDGHDVLYFDDHHLSVSGARKLAAAIKPLLEGHPAYFPIVRQIAARRQQG